jgi:SAM-dependent methyltransferase
VVFRVTGNVVHSQAVRFCKWLHQYFWLRYLTLVPHRLLLCAKYAIAGVPEAGSLHDPGYSEKMLRRYMAFAGVSSFRGKVAEVGPGTRTDVAELLLANGAAWVDQIDRFQAAKGHNRIRRHIAPAEKFFASHRGYDFILSNAVLEHLYDPLVALRVMADALAPGGAMVHIVDLRDHGNFSPPLHELSFLRLSDALYWPLKIQGGPNRVRAEDYRKCLASLHVAAEIHPTSLVGCVEEFWDHPGDIPSQAFEKALREALLARPYLARQFTTEPAEDLAVNGIAVVARRTR